MSLYKIRFETDTGEDLTEVMQWVIRRLFDETSTIGAGIYSSLYISVYADGLEVPEEFAGLLEDTARDEIAIRYLRGELVHDRIEIGVTF